MPRPRSAQPRPERAGTKYGTIAGWLVAGAGAFILAVAGTPAAQGTAPANFRVTLNASVTESDTGGCCFTFNFFRGTAGIPRVGPADFTGNTETGVFPFEEPPTAIRGLVVNITGKNGRRRTLEIDAGGLYPAGAPPPQTWTASGSGFSGSGTYTATPDFSAILFGQEFTITFSGTLLPT